MKFRYFNDTKRTIFIHSATFIHGCETDRKSIKPLEVCTFTLPAGTTPFIKLWDHGENGLELLVSPQKEDNFF